MRKKLKKKAARVGQSDYYVRHFQSQQAFGILGGSASTFSAIKEIGYTHFTPPCYISAFSNELNEPNVGGHINCCGYSQTETVFTNTSQFCSPPNLKFYD